MSDAIDFGSLNILGDLLLNFQEDEQLKKKWTEDFDKSVKELNDHQVELEKKAQSDEKGAQRKMNALAKGIPAFSKGVISAVQGFQKGDPMSGAAGIIDAVSSIITLVSSISAAGGPPGAIVGALLSVVSMVLKLFSVQKPTKSLIDKLEEVIRKHDLENKLQHLKTAQTMIQQCMEKIIPDNYDKYSFNDAVSTFNINETSKEIVEATFWLTERNNQELPLWGTVLAIQCTTYVAHLQSIVGILALIKGEEDKKKFAGMFSNTLVDHQLEFLKEIKPVARNRGTIWLGTYYGYLRTRDIVVSSKKASWVKCGVAKGKRSRIQSLAVTIRPVSDPKESGETLQSAHPILAQFSVENNATRNMFGKRQDLLQYINTPFKYRHYHRHNLRARIGGSTFDSNDAGILLRPVPSEKNSLDSLEKFPPIYAVSALPGHEAHKVFVYTAHGSSIIVWEHGAKKHSSEEKEELHLIYEKKGYDDQNIGAICAVFPKNHPEDPFQCEKFDGISENIVYGACEVKAISQYHVAKPHEFLYQDHMVIRCDLFRHEIPTGGDQYQIQDGGTKSFLSPWPNFVGITTDSHFLWVYRAGAIACATHSSIRKCLDGGNHSKPDWMIYHLPPNGEGISKSSFDPNSLGEIQIPGMMNPIINPLFFFKMGLIDLAACDDGTLTAVLSENPKWDSTELPGYIYTMTPQIDLKKNTLEIKGTKVDDLGHPVETSGWKSDYSFDTAFRVFKQPIFCWSLVEGLTNSLEKMSVSTKTDNILLE